MLIVNLEKCKIFKKFKIFFKIILLFFMFTAPLNLVFKGPYIFLMNSLINVFIIFLVLWIFIFAFNENDKDRQLLLKMFGVYFAVISVCAAIFWNVNLDYKQTNFEFKKTAISYYIELNKTKEAKKVFNEYNNTVSLIFKDLVKKSNNKLDEDKKINSNTENIYIWYLNITLFIGYEITLFMLLWGLVSLKFFHCKNIQNTKKYKRFSVA